MPYNLLKVHIFWESHKILRNLHRRFDWHYLHRTNLRWRFRKILWPSQNIWTLKVWSYDFLFAVFFSPLKYKNFYWVSSKWCFYLMHIDFGLAYQASFSKIPIDHCKLVCFANLPIIQSHLQNLPFDLWRMESKIFWSRI